MTSDAWSRLGTATRELRLMNLYVEDQPDSSIDVVELRSLQLRDEVGPLGLVIVDPIQMLARTSDDDVDDDATDEESIVRRLKVLARSLDVPLLATSHVRDVVDRRSDKRPVLSDLDFRSLEDASDVVLFVYRADHYDEFGDQQGIAEIQIAKNRRGPTGLARTAFLRRYTKFADLAAA